jgi:hypothetical protein
VLYRRPRVEELGAADHLLETPYAEPGHPFAHFLGDEEEIVDDVLGLALEALDELRVLRGDADRAGIQVALAHHDAALGHERRGGEAELVGAEERADHDVAPRLHLSVRLHRDAAAQPVQHQRLLRLREPDFPRAARVLHRRQRRGPGAPVVPGDGDVVRLRLRHARGDRAHADLGHELDGDPRLRVHVLQVVDELRQVLDRIDVVVRGRRDEAHAGDGVAHLGDVPGNLVAGKLAALAGLRALGHLDLQVVGVDEVFGRHAEASRRHLLDRRAHRVAAREPFVTHRVLAALAGIRLAADAVHGDRERRMRLVRDRPERHRAGGEALDDVGRGLDLLEGHGRGRLLDAEEAAQGEELLALLVDERRSIP